MSEPLTAQSTEILEAAPGVSAGFGTKVSAAPVGCPAIYKAIADVIADVGAVGKDKVNKQQGFKFRSVDDVYNALHPALAKNKVFIVPEILDQKRETHQTKSGTQMILVICKIRFTFYAEDGSYIQSVIIGEGLDTGDKATNKAMAIAYKYACFQVFCIPTEEMADPDSESLEIQNDEKTGTKKKGTARKSSTKKEDSKNEESQKGDVPTQTENSGQEATPDSKITAAMVNTIRAEEKRTGVTDEQILSRKRISAKRIEDMTVAEFKYVMQIFEVTKAKAADQNGGKV